MEYDNFDHHCPSGDKQFHDLLKGRQEDEVSYSITEPCRETAVKS